MKVLVVGANGKTGKLVIKDAIEKGHDVTALVRDPSKLKQSGVKIIQGDSTKLADVQRAITGNEAVIDAIGGSTPYKMTTLEQDTAGNIIQAMRGENIRRLSVISMMGVGTSRGQAPLWYRYLLMPSFLRGATQDKDAMERKVRRSGLDFVIARPPMLKDSPATGSVKIINQNETGHTISRADLASFLVDQLNSQTYVRQAVTVVNN